MNWIGGISQGLESISNIFWDYKQKSQKMQSIEELDEVISKLERFAAELYHLKGENDFSIRYELEELTHTNMDPNTVSRIGREVLEVYISVRKILTQISQSDGIPFDTKDKIWILTNFRSGYKDLVATFEENSTKENLQNVLDNVDTLITAYDSALLSIDESIKVARLKKEELLDKLN